MKTVIMTYVIIVLGSLFCLVCCWWIAFDHVEAMIHGNCKHALAYAMKISRYDDGVNANSFMRHFENYFMKNTFAGYRYQLRLIGFMNEPLFASVEVKVNGKGMHIQVRETMLEEVRENE